MLRHRQTEAPTSVWDQEYENERTPWRSSGLSLLSRELLNQHRFSGNVLEIGCGMGDDAGGLVDIGLEYLGIDCSRFATSEAKSLYPYVGSFQAADFFDWLPDAPFSVAYDKGMFHGLGGEARRSEFVEKLATVLNPGGRWLSVNGAADTRRSDFSHGAVYLTDIVSAVEDYFEILDVRKSSYGLLDSKNDFQAWYIVSRRR